MARTKQGVFSWEDVLAQRYQSNKPPPLQEPRHQILTATQPQLQSGLLSRLFPELRLIIWEYVLGGRRLHIIQRAQQRLGHIVCPHSASSLPSQDKNLLYRASNSSCEICLGTGIPQPIKDADLHGSGEKLLSLALTSRQMYKSYLHFRLYIHVHFPFHLYQESIHLLYTLNTFEFSNPWTLPYLHPTIPEENWDCIHNIELRWSFPGHWLPCKDPVRTVYVAAGRAEWLETCNALKTLPKLRSFVLILSNQWYSEPKEKLHLFLAPLRGLLVQRSRRLPLRSVNKFSEDKRGSPGSGFRSASTSTASSPSMFPSAGSVSGSGTSSDEESGSLSSSPASGSRFPLRGDTDMRSYFYSCSARDASSSRASVPVDIESAGWELHLQALPYYTHELGWVGDDLRRRGIDCYISMM
ncbi:hypothetical protein N7478_003445 [Penicillium angulare]|uniref:uncharacterized protein n=1 Tax=Penicillium angulare TaxID=116970 RepID=UPI00253FD42A|nr:uncharacterized protein N7478_003445 [Penicillium angulare]KAJ5287759.1 hypothetical protein N7478_003445 [Penicillium angulare]